MDSIPSIDDANGNLATWEETVGTETRTTTYTYDSANRVYYTENGDVKALFNYDKFSRTYMRQTHYLNYLTDAGIVTGEMNYSTGGRPCMMYKTEA